MFSDPCKRPFRDGALSVLILLGGRPCARLVPSVCRSKLLYVRCRYLRYCTRVALSLGFLLEDGTQPEMPFQRDSASAFPLLARFKSDTSGVRLSRKMPRRQPAAFARVSPTRLYRTIGRAVTVTKGKVGGGKGGWGGRLEGEGEREREKGGGGGGVGCGFWSVGVCVALRVACSYAFEHVFVHLTSVLHLLRHHVPVSVVSTSNIRACRLSVCALHGLPHHFARKPKGEIMPHPTWPPAKQKLYKKACSSTLARGRRRMFENHAIPTRPKAFRQSSRGQNRTRERPCRTQRLSTPKVG